MTPTIHSNGTDGEALLDQACAALTALRDAMTAMEGAGPNGRDYYTQGPDALAQATREHRERIAMVRAVADEFEQLAESISDSI